MANGPKGAVISTTLDGHQMDTIKSTEHDTVMSPEMVRRLCDQVPACSWRAEP